MIKQSKEMQFKKKCISIQPRGPAYGERPGEILNREPVEERDRIGKKPDRIEIIVNSKKGGKNEVR
jgi:hypothetical protein